MPKLDLNAIEPKVYGADDPCGAARRFLMGDAGGLTQFGVVLEELAPGSRSSDRHWHAEQDEFLLMLDGTAVLLEETGEVPLVAGDAVAWKAGEPNGHHIVNRSDGPVRFLVIGARTPTDEVHYPDLGRTTYHHADGTWQSFADDGTVLGEGRD